MKLWSDLTTGPGVMAVFSKQELCCNVRAASPLPLTLVCDNVRQPDNLGALLRVTAGARRVLLIKGTTDLWSSKLLRAAAGANFQVPVVEEVGWEVLEHHLEDRFSELILADLLHAPLKAPPDPGLLKRLEQEEDPEWLHLYKDVTIRASSPQDFSFQTGFKEVVAVVGGEQSVSGAGYRLPMSLNEWQPVPCSLEKQFEKMMLLFLTFCL